MVSLFTSLLPLTMAKLDNSNIILIVKPGGDPITHDVLLSMVDKSRIVTLDFNHSLSTCSNFDQGNRDCTPYFLPPKQIELDLKLDSLPKDSKQGFVFASDRTLCDVVLSQPSVSRKQCAIDFNWNSGCIRITNLSKIGTRITIPP